MFRQCKPHAKEIKQLPKERDLQVKRKISNYNTCKQGRSIKLLLTRQMTRRIEDTYQIIGEIQIKRLNLIIFKRLSSCSWISSNKLNNSLKKSNSLLSVKLLLLLLLLTSDQCQILHNLLINKRAKAILNIINSLLKMLHIQ